MNSNAVSSSIGSELSKTPCRLVGGNNFHCILVNFYPVKFIFLTVTYHLSKIRFNNYYKIQITSISAFLH